MIRGFNWFRRIQNFKALGNQRFFYTIKKDGLLPTLSILIKCDE